MARWEVLVVAAATVGVQLLGMRGLTPWSPTSLFVGLLMGILITPFVELRDDLRDLVRKAGGRRTLIWIVALAAWTIATLGLAFALALAAGLDRVPFAG
jgi:hypothetical protein